MSSICCNAETKIGYYNASERPDIHGVINENMIAFGIMGTYCTKCNKLCDYISKGVEHFTNGMIKNK